MKIRSEQMREMARLASLNFETRIIAILYENYPESKAVPSDELRTGVQEQIRKAQTSYGFETEQQLANYVHSAWVLGTDFATRFPAAAERLSSRAYTTQDKSDWLAAWTKALFDALALPE